MEDSLHRHEDAAIERKILTTLSMNGRAPLRLIGKKIGLTKHPTYRRVLQLEEKYSMRYLEEIDAEKLGYLAYVSFVKFDEKMPRIDAIRSALESNPRVQLVLLTSGRYDMVVYFLAKSNREIAQMIHDLQSLSAFNTYSSRWYTMPFLSTYSFVPLRREFFDLLKARIWKRTRENPHRKPEEILYREYAVLYELNENGNLNFREIDIKYGLNRGTSQYTYYRLREREIIKRITITTKHPGLKYNAIILMEILGGLQFSQTRRYLLSEIIRTGEDINKYALVGDIQTPHGIMLVLPVFDEAQLQETEDRINEAVKGVNLATMIVTNTVIGSFCYRLFDNDYSNQYKILAQDYKTVKPKIELESYE